MTIQQVDANVGYGTADRNFLGKCAPRTRSRLESGRGNASLSGAIGVHPTHSPADNLGPLGVRSCRNLLASHNNQTQTLRHRLLQLRKFMNPLVPVSRWQIQNRYALALDPGQEFRNSDRRPVGPKYESSSACPGDKDLFHGDVEAD